MPTTHLRRAAHRRALFGETERPETGGLARGVSGVVLDASPHLLVLGEGGAEGAETRIAMSGDTAIWHGGRGGPAALRPGRSVVVRRTDGGRADRIWVGIGRVSGTILASGRDGVEVDMGPHRGRARVEIAPSALGLVLVRHPRLEPGYLIDVICVRSPGGPRAVRPGTSQPGYRAADLAAPEAAAPVPEVLRGTATWFGGVEGEWRDGASYPAVDAEGDAGGCADAPSGCVPMPYLSLGSEVVVRNECGGRSARVPVIECGCTAALFCDRCVDCEASPRGRIVELTPAAFAGLGGDLAAGCFNAAVRPGVREGPW
ncbi:hypothetical protein [Actinomadura sp. NPDC000600]|uniref:hypothetical protein n=1 Tax=Actinomadura sp. NPDC000600 TaxID=3154262 RepID=UPI003398B855